MTPRTENFVSETPNTSAKKTGNRTVLIAIVIAAVVFAIFFIMRSQQAIAKQKAFAAQRAAAEEKSRARTPVKVVHAVPQTVQRRIEITGTLKPWREAELAFEVAGRLANLPVKAGDHVKEGQVLAALDGSRVGAQLEQATAASKAASEQLALANDELRRTEALAASKSISQAQLEQARRQAGLAKAQYEGAVASQRLVGTGTGDRVIRAPFSGLIVKAPTSSGSVVNPGVPLLRLEDVSRFRLAGTVSEDDAPQVKVGDVVAIQTRERTVKGAVTTLVPSLDQATRRAPVEIEVPNSLTEPILAWSFVRASIEGRGTVNVLKLPATARRIGGQAEVFRLIDGRAKSSRVVYSVDTEGNLLVKEGITAEEEIIDSPPKDLRDGEAVVLAGDKP